MRRHREIITIIDPDSDSFVLRLSERWTGFGLLHTRPPFIYAIFHDPIRFIVSTVCHTTFTQPRMDCRCANANRLNRCDWIMNAFSLRKSILVVRVENEPSIWIKYQLVDDSDDDNVFVHSVVAAVLLCLCRCDTIVETIAYNHWAISNVVHATTILIRWHVFIHLLFVSSASLYSIYAFIFAQRTHTRIEYWSLVLTVNPSNGRACGRNRLMEQLSHGEWIKHCDRWREGERDNYRL